jgi:hypothetical protein
LSFPRRPESYGALAALLAASGASDTAAVVADGAYPTGKDVFENINHYFVHNHWERTLDARAVRDHELSGCAVRYRRRLLRPNRNRLLRRTNILQLNLQRNFWPKHLEKSFSLSFQGEPS